MAWRHHTETRNDRVFAHIPAKHRKTIRRRIWYMRGFEEAGTGGPMRSLAGLMPLEIEAYTDGFNDARNAAPASLPDS